MKRRFFTVWLGVIFGLLIVVFAPAASAWAPADQADIHPGVMTFTDGAQCTSNFIFSDARG